MPYSPARRAAWRFSQILASTRKRNQKVCSTQKMSPSVPSRKPQAEEVAIDEQAEGPDKQWQLIVFLSQETFALGRVAACVGLKRTRSLLALSTQPLRRSDQRLCRMVHSVNGMWMSSTIVPRQPIIASTFENEVRVVLAVFAPTDPGAK